jgi:hypothetical protein
VERLGEPALGQAVGARRPAHPAADEVLQLSLGQMTDLGDVFAQGRPPAVDHVGDADGVIGSRAAAQPHLRDRPRRQVLGGEQLGEGEGVAGVRVDRAQGRLADGHVVGVAGADPLPQPLR